jgi:hypothetical protein
LLSKTKIEDEDEKEDEKDFAFETAPPESTPPCYGITSCVI